MATSRAVLASGASSGAKKPLPEQLKECCAAMAAPFSGYKLDPYFTITLRKQGEKQPLVKHTTAVLANAGSAPVLSEKDHRQVRWDGLNDIDEKSILTIECWDKDTVGVDDSCGKGSVPVGSLMEKPDTAQNMVFNLKSGAALCGDVYATCKWEPETKSLTVSIEHAEGIVGALEANRDVSTSGVVYALLGLAVYVTFGVIYYTEVEGWKGGESFLFVVTVINTVGYGMPGSWTGDYNHHSTYGFTAFFVLIGVGTVAMLISLIVDYAVQSVENNTPEMDVGAIFAATPDIPVPEHFGIAAFWGKVKGKVAATPRTVWVLCVYMLVGTLFFANVNDDIDGRYDIALYFVIISLTTVGFGDFGFTSENWLNVITAFYILIGVILTGAAIGDVVALMQMESIKRETEQRLANAFRSAEDFEYFDDDGSGSVSEAEFIAKILVRLKIVKQSTIDDLLGKFNQLDHNGSGSINIEEFARKFTGKEFTQEQIDNMRQASGKGGLGGAARGAFGAMKNMGSDFAGAASGAIGRAAGNDDDYGDDE